MSLRLCATPQIYDPTTRNRRILLLFRADCVDGGSCGDRPSDRGGTRLDRTGCRRSRGLPVQFPHSFRSPAQIGGPGPVRPHCTACPTKCGLPVQVQTKTKRLSVACLSKFRLLSRTRPTRREARRDPNRGQCRRHPDLRFPAVPMPRAGWPDRHRRPSRRRRGLRRRKT